MRHLENESVPHKESQKIPALQVLAPANRFSRLANLPDGHLGWSRAITSAQHDPSANSPCTMTTFRAFGAGCASAAYWSRGLAAPAAILLTNARRSIGVLPLTRFDPGPACRTGRIGTFRATSSPPPRNACRSLVAWPPFEHGRRWA